MTTSETLLTIGRLGGGLLVVIALVLISGRVAKRLRGQSGASGLRVVDRIVLSKEAHLAVVETGGRRLILGVTPQHVTMIGPLDDDGTAPGAVLEPMVVLEPVLAAESGLEAEAVLGAEAGAVPEAEAVLEVEAVPEAEPSELAFVAEAPAPAPANAAWAEAEAQIREELAEEEPVAASDSTGLATPADVPDIADVTQVADLAEVADVAEVDTSVTSAGHGRRALTSDALVDGASEPADESASAGSQIPAQRRSERIRAERQARHEQAEREAELKTQLEKAEREAELKAAFEAAAQAEAAAARLLAEAQAPVAKPAPSVGWLRTPQAAYQATDQATQPASGQTAGPEQHDADQRERHEAERLLALREIAEREAELEQRAAAAAAAAAAKTPNFSGHPDLASALRAVGRTVPSGTASTAPRLPQAGPATAPAAQPTSGGTQPVAQAGNPAGQLTAAGPSGPQVPEQREQASGSVLSPATWRQGIEALRELTARRG